MTPEHRRETRKYQALGCLTLIGFTIGPIWAITLIPPAEIRSTPTFYWGSRALFLLLLGLIVWATRGKDPDEST